MSSSSTQYLCCGEREGSSVNCICIGSGRFLRSVLVPALNGTKVLHTAIFQTRGRTFLSHCEGSCNTGELWYEVDTVAHDGSVLTERVKFAGVGTLGTEEGKQACWTLLSQMKDIRVIGVGVTEAGLSSPASQAMLDLTQLLYKCFSSIQANRLECGNPNARITVINTDNVPQNGHLMRNHVLAIAKEGCAQDSEQFIAWLTSTSDKGGVVFCNTMVDRITSQRDGSKGMVPRCEPVPAKALVIEDLANDLPPELCTSHLAKKYGVRVRTHPAQLDADIALKLRVANATHTASAHAMALSSLTQTDCLSSDNDSAGPTLTTFLDALFQSQILPAASSLYTAAETAAVYEDWRKRLRHAHFGLSSFFITQNGAAKGGIRLAPTVRSLLMEGKDAHVSMAFAFAALLRFLTPYEDKNNNDNNKNVYRGRLDAKNKSDNNDSIEYADGMSYNLQQGWYEFKCSCEIVCKNTVSNLPEALGRLSCYGAACRQPAGYQLDIQAYLTSKEGGDMKDLFDCYDTRTKMEELVQAIATLYSRMVAGDAVLDILAEMIEKKQAFAEKGLESPCTVLVDYNLKMGGDNDVIPLHYRPCPVPSDSHLLDMPIAIANIDEIISVVKAEVASTTVIDLHTHLLPPSHGALCLWGIDELLTYHYLVAEYFMTAPATVSPAEFYAMEKRNQADLIWQALFIDRTPVSEACRGVITTLTKLGLKQEVCARDLTAIRQFYSTFRSEGVAGVERFSEMVYKVAGVRYAVMTNIPFDVNEVAHWRPKRKEYPEQYKSALRVDPLLAGDEKTVQNALQSSGYDCTLEGARQYLRDWVDTMKPEYMMASTPHNFSLAEEEGIRGNLQGVKKTGVNQDAMKTPFAFADFTSSDAKAVNCDAEEDATPTVIRENNNVFLSEVLMQVCEELDLPLALKIGAHRGVNAQLKSAGDGMVAFADTNVLARLCTRYPKVRFLATFLSKNNQHDACVLASKFRNLHIYGCWWYCNNPSLIREITTMRVEMLGCSAFTAQHSDARVLDQLVYKWSHSRAVIAQVLVKEYEKLVQSGWMLTRRDVMRDVKMLFGGSYEEFMKKSFVANAL